MPDFLGGLKSLGTALWNNKGKIADGAKRVGTAIKDNPDVSLAAASGVMGARDNARGDALDRQALDAATGAYNESAPLRAMGMAGMMSNERPDLSSVYHASGNPFEQYAGSTAGGTQTDGSTRGAGAPVPSIVGHDPMPQPQTGGIMARLRGMGRAPMMQPQ